MFIFNTLLLGNLIKEVKRNNMFITLELKKMSASFQNLPTLPYAQFYSELVKRTLKHCSRNFDDYNFILIISLLLFFLLLCNSDSTLQALD